MRTETRPVFIAFDGNQFSTERECREHEDNSLNVALAKLPSETLASAIYSPTSRNDWELADLIERAGAICKAKRLAAGRRHRAAPDRGDPTTAEEGSANG
jgi:hypothetical protein